jgi:hypothetical protein
MTTVTISRAKFEELLKASVQVPMTKQVGTKLVAEKVAAIKMILKEIKEVVELSGAEVKIGGSYGVFESEIEAIDSMHPDWNSSSYDC